VTVTTETVMTGSSRGGEPPGSGSHSPFHTIRWQQPSDTRSCKKDLSRSTWSGHSELATHKVAKVTMTRAICEAELDS
jgi:hypothetical protein